MSQPVSQLTIDLAAIRENYRILERQAAPAPVCAVVKADAYGLGVSPVAKALWQAGCRTFFTAHLEEAATVRGLLPDAEIAVLNGLLAGEEATFREHRLIPVLNDLGQVRGWSRFCAGNTPLPAILHVDTGMARLGLPPVELAWLLETPDLLSPIPLRFIMSHLACADEPGHPLNRRQQRDFTAALARLSGHIPKTPAMLAASSGIFLGPDWRFQAVRPGVSLYGGSPDIRKPNPMRPVVRLQARIVQIREVPAGRTVGYGATFRTTAPTRIATLAAGYSDGYLRSLSSRATLHINGRAVPVVGRVSMDLITADITRMPDRMVGEMVDLIGPEHGIDALAAEAGTIANEILTSLGSRYHRVYAGGST